VTKPAPDAIISLHLPAPPAPAPQPATQLPHALRLPDTFHPPKPPRRRDRAHRVLRAHRSPLDGLPVRRHCRAGLRHHGGRGPGHQQRVPRQVGGGGGGMEWGLPAGRAPVCLPSSNFAARSPARPSPPPPPPPRPPGPTPPIGSDPTGPARGRPGAARTLVHRAPPAPRARRAGGPTPFHSPGRRRRPLLPAAPGPNGKARQTAPLDWTLTPALLHAAPSPRRRLLKAFLKFGRRPRPPPELSLSRPPLPAAPLAPCPYAAPLVPPGLSPVCALVARPSLTAPSHRECPPGWPASLAPAAPAHAPSLQVQPNRPGPAPPRPVPPSPARPGLPPSAGPSSHNPAPRAGRLGGRAPPHLSRARAPQPNPSAAAPHTAAAGAGPPQPTPRAPPPPGPWLRGPNPTPSRARARPLPMRPPPFAWALARPFSCHHLLHGPPHPSHVPSRHPVPPPPAPPAPPTRLRAACPQPNCHCRTANPTPVPPQRNLLSHPARARAGCPQAPTACGRLLFSLTAGKRPSERFLASEYM
jgi:hypothetical protein